MARKSKKSGIKKLQINFTNRWLYTLIVFFSLIVVGVFVYAAVGTTPNPGHSIAELQLCDVEGEILKNVGGAWACGTDDTGTSLWGVWNSNLYYTDGQVGIFGSANPTLQFGNSWSSTPWAGVKLHIADKFLEIGDWWQGGGEVGVRFWTNDNERMRIDTSGNVIIDGNVYANAFSGDGSGITNLIVRLQGIDDTCDNTMDGLLRYRSSYCINPTTRTSSFAICMRQTDSYYSWYTIKSYSWSDACTCPSGTTYFECTGDYDSPGCYASKPSSCFRHTRDPPEK